MAELYRLYPGRPVPLSRGIGARWLQMIEGMDDGRLRRGRSYARAGNVTNIGFTDGGVQARVRGNHYAPYQVTLRIPSIPRDVWAEVLESIAADTQLVAAILTGTVPPEVERLLGERGHALYPGTLLDSDDECSCYDWSRPCKHIAAVYYVLADVLDADPLALLALRGLPKDDLIEHMETIRGRLLAERFGESEVADDEENNAGEAPEPAGNFWSAGIPLDTIPIRAEPPTVHALPLKSLGQAPYGYDRREFMAKAEQIYAAISQAGLRLLIEQALDTVAEPNPAMVERSGGQPAPRSRHRVSR